MPTLSVRRLDETTYGRLRVRAAKHGHSMEEEARQIIRNAVAAPDKLGALAVQYFGRANGVDLELPPRLPHEPVNLDP